LFECPDDVDPGGYQEDGGEEWIPYMEVRDLEVFADYLRI
jgi:hypothetical protein